ncbi:MAG: hypothetical protein HKN27_11750 [Silicimonas sp.]|nr:hypothetical protein [Silicimonas sp.]
MPSAKRLFLIGAPKCATSSLAEWLGRHSCIKLSRHKEPGFFRTGERRWIPDANFPDQYRTQAPQTYMSDPTAYENLFGDADADIWRLDASTDYFSDLGSAARITKVAREDDVRIICVIRDPIERLFSEYKHTIRDGIEPLSFRDSIVAEPERMAEGYQPLFFHIDRSRYFKHLKRWLHYFGDDLLVLSINELEDPQKLMGKIAEFVGIAHESLGEIGEENRSDRDLRCQSKGALKHTKALAKWLLETARLRDRSAQMPKLSDKDGDFVFELLRDDIQACLDDPRIPTSDWPKLYCRTNNRDK